MNPLWANCMQIVGNCGSPGVIFWSRSDGPNFGASCHLFIKRHQYKIICINFWGAQQLLFYTNFHLSSDLIQSPIYRVVYLVVFYLRPPSAKWKQFLVLDIKWVYFFGQPYENLDPPMTFPIEKEQPMQILGRIVPMVWLLSSNRQRERGREDIYISRFQRRYFLQTSMLLRQEKKVYSSRKRNTLDTIFGHKWKKAQMIPYAILHPGKEKNFTTTRLTHLLTYLLLGSYSNFPQIPSLTYLRSLELKWNAKKESD